MLGYNEGLLAERLSRLDAWGRAAFALACAQRLLPLYVRYHDVTHEGDAEFANGAVEDLWRSLRGPSISRDELERLASRAQELVPDGQAVGVSAWHWYAIDAMAALAYAAESQFTDGTDPALWAARQAFEAAELYVRGRDHMDLHSMADVGLVDNDPVVQEELRRQDHDLTILSTETPAVERLIEVRRVAERARLFDLDTVP